jgi:microsomal epoxide hydrolase
MDTRPFRIQVEQQVLDDLHTRLQRTRSHSLPTESGWKLGTSSTYLQQLLTHWRVGYSWHEQEAELNRLSHFKTTLDGTEIHFVHARGNAPNRVPLLLLHGWPDSFYRFYKVIPLLVAFDLVVPSLPGFGFSGPPQRTQQEQPIRQSARLLRKLMTEVLGHARFGVVGGDTGATIAQAMALEHPENVVGIHITDLGWRATSIDESSATAEERKYLAASKKHFMADGAYTMVQTTRPRSLGPALTDSPAGLASWILDRFHSWTDPKDDGVSRFSRDELLTNIMLYWVTGSIASSIFTYCAEARSPSLNGSDRVDVPVAVALFPNDMGGTPPRSLAERNLNVQRWTEMPRGGHFAALEEPELFATDVAEFFGSLAPDR